MLPSAQSPRFVAKRRLNLAHEDLRVCCSPSIVTLEQLPWTRPFPCLAQGRGKLTEMLKKTIETLPLI